MRGKICLAFTLLAGLVPFQSVGQLPATLDFVARKPLGLKVREQTLMLTPSGKFGLNIYRMDNLKSTGLERLEEEIRKKMSGGGPGSNTERQRWVATAIKDPTNLRAVFGAMLSSWIWMDQRFQVGDDRYARQEDNDRHASALLIAKTGTRDPAALRLLLAYELDNWLLHEKAHQKTLLAAGKHWHSSAPQHFELRRGLAYALSVSPERKDWPEGDRMVAKLLSERPRDWTIRLMSMSVHRWRFVATKDPQYGRKALVLLEHAKREAPPGTTLAVKTLPYFERFTRASFKEINVEP